MFQPSPVFVINDLADDCSRWRFIVGCVGEFADRIGVNILRPHSLKKLILRHFFPFMNKVKHARKKSLIIKMVRRAGFEPDSIRYERIASTAKLHGALKVNSILQILSILSTPFLRFLTPNQKILFCHVLVW